MIAFETSCSGVVPLAAEANTTKAMTPAAKAAMMSSLLLATRMEVSSANLEIILVARTLASNTERIPNEQ